MASKIYYIPATNDRLEKNVAIYCRVSTNEKEQLYSLSSQILKRTRKLIYITPKDKITIYMKKNLISEQCDYPENNSLYMILLSGNLVTYGDENRTKQRHLATSQIYKGVLDNIKSDKEGYYCNDITNFIKEYKDLYSLENANNIFFIIAWYKLAMKIFIF